MKVALEIVRRRLDPPVSNARNTWTERESIVLELRDGEGNVGRGEAAPLPGYSLDTLSDCRTALERIDWHAPVQLEALPPAARFAVEAATLGLQAAAERRPLWSLLARSATPRPVAALIDSAEEGLALLRRGVRTFKLKLRSAADVAKATELRAALGDVSLRFDANGAFSLSEAPGILEALARVTPEFVEEPVPRGDLARLGRPPVPLAADESLQDPATREAALEVCQYVVLKPTTLGGFRPCLELARGRKAVVSHAWEGPIGLAACAALAVAIPGPACGLPLNDPWVVP